MRILVVEDNEDSRIIQENILESKGHAVSCAGNGREAMEMIRTLPPDLIISDILMPEMDGFALCRAIKADEKFRKIPVVFYTATYTDPKDERLALEMGASRFILKPAEPVDFIKEIEEVIEEHKSKKLTVREQSVKDGEELEQAYTEAVTRKLDKKIRELEDERHKLQVSEQKYRRLVEVLREDYFFYTQNTDGVFGYISPSIANVLGYSQEEFRVHYIEYLTDNPVNKAVVCHTKLSIKGEKQAPYEVEIYHKDGTRRYLEVSEEPVFDHAGYVVSVEGIVHDITKRKIAEAEKIALENKLRQAQKMEAIGTLAGGIAHDFNNMLTPIFGYAEMALESFPEGSPDRDYQLKVMTAAKRAKDLVNQILTFSRQTEQEKKPVQLQIIAKEALKLLRSSIPTTVEIRQNIQPYCGTVMADPIQLHQVIMNLCTNAYHAMREGGGVLGVSVSEIEIERYDKITGPELLPGRYLRMEISDTGTGMDKDTMERIFDPYFTTKDTGEGTGVGLSVVHGIVKNHGGDIRVYSEPGKGSTFHIFFPVLSLEPVSVVSEIADPLPLGTESVMLVEDEDYILQMEQTILDRLGYRVLAYSKSKDALEAFQKSNREIDLVITDMTMPKMTGADLARELLAIRSDIPIILCTGYSEIMDGETAKAIGIREYIMKPLVLRDFARTIRNVLDN